MFAKLKASLFIILLMWLVALLNLWFDLNQYGIVPREPSGLIGIITSPFLHASLYDNPIHLINNTVFLIFLLPITFIFYDKIAYKILSFIIILAGLLVWIFARPSNHIGASTLIFGLLSFLFFSSIIRRDLKALLGVIAVFISYSVIIYGFFPSDTSQIIGVLDAIVHNFLKGLKPGQSYISWEGHLFGAIAGLSSAFLLRETRDRGKG